MTLKKFCITGPSPYFDLWSNNNKFVVVIATHSIMEMPNLM
jgi:hypothetical protein